MSFFLCCMRCRAGNGNPYYSESHRSCKACLNQLVHQGSNCGIEDVLLARILVVDVVEVELTKLQKNDTSWAVQQQVAAAASMVAYLAPDTLRAVSDGVSAASHTSTYQHTWSWSRSAVL